MTISDLVFFMILPLMHVSMSSLNVGQADNQAASEFAGRGDHQQGAAISSFMIHPYFRAPVQSRCVEIRRQRNLAPSLLGAFRKMPKTTRNLNGQTIAQLAGEHDNLPAMMTFMRDEIG